MDLQFGGKRVLVTGGTRGIGRATVLAFAQRGAQVATCYRQDGEAVDSLARELKELGGDHLVIRADVSQPEDVESLLAECESKFGGIDALVHNAGVISHIPFAKLPLAEWRRIIDTNLTGAFLVSQGILKIMPDGGSIVLIGSRVATIGLPTGAHYTSSKAGLVGLARTMTKELGARGIRVNVVAPGVIETEEAAKLTPEQAEAKRARYRQLTALGRCGEPAEVADVICYLSSDQASYITGETVNVDGGI